MFNKQFVIRTTIKVDGEVVATSKNKAESDALQQDKELIIARERQWQRERRHRASDAGICSAHAASFLKLFKD